jgi:hypothetical protein
MNEFEDIFTFIFPFFFIGMWCFVLRILSYMSGWTQLAERFHHSKKFQGTYYRFQSVKLGKVNFRSSLEMGVNDQGLFLIPTIIFRLFHKPLLIPWEEISAEPLKKFLFNGYRLSFRSSPGITMEIYKRTFEKMKGYLKLRTGFQQVAQEGRGIKPPRPLA